MLKLFIVSSLICLVIHGHFAFQSWVESVPFTDSWAYFRNYHPVRHNILIMLKWGTLGASLLTGALLTVKRAFR